ncbi:hypothetical protein EI94DRAFT_1801297 [Lactarius quietus]|nr:hypothetical protein EI94DRAFT_1801297 [Lactarius quietus]
MAASVYAAQISAGGCPHAHGHGRTSPISNPSSATLGGPNIVNAVVVNPTGQPLYSISSVSKHTKLLLHRDNFEVATVDWDCSSPRMVFRGKKLKCKEWLTRAGRPGLKTEHVHHAPSARSPL